MRLPLAAAALALALTSAPSCGDSGGGGPRLVQLVACPGSLPCAVETSHGYVGGEAAVSAQIRPAVAAACARLHAECAYVCANPFARCGDSAAQCTADSVASYVDALDYPVVDASLVARCKLDIGRAACTDIPPDTVACDEALVEGCPADHDSLGTPYSHLAAPTLGAVPSELVLHLCDGVAEWFAVPLARGQALTLRAREAEPSFGQLWTELALVGPGDDTPTLLASESMAWQGEDPTPFDPVDADGTYLVRLDFGGAPTLDLTLTVDATPPRAR